jgi:hypothetical protein
MIDDLLAINLTRKYTKPVIVEPDQKIFVINKKFCYAIASILNLSLSKAKNLALYHNIQSLNLIEQIDSSCSAIPSELLS